MNSYVCDQWLSGGAMLVHGQVHRQCHTMIFSIGNELQSKKMETITSDLEMVETQKKD